MRKILLGISLLLLGASLTGCGGSNELVAFEEGDTIRVGMEVGYAPFNWSVTTPNDYTLPVTNTAAYADGYDVQVASYIAKELKCSVEIYALEWDALILNLKMGDIDLIIAGMSPTAERQKEVYFSDAYYTAQHVVLMEVGSKYEDATTLSDFSGAKGVCQVNTVYDDLLDQLSGVQRLTARTSVNECVLELTRGDADISIVELPVAQAIVAANPNLMYVSLTDGFVVSDEDKCVSIALTLNNKLLQDQINGVLATLSEDTRTKFMNDAVSRQDSDNA